MTTIKKRISASVAATFVAASLSVLAVSPASAAHCSDPNDRPGNSEFSDHARGNPHNEGVHQGWSSCEEQANSGNDNHNRDNGNRKN